MVDRYDVFSSLFFRAYALLWRVARPLLRRNRRLREGWSERLVPPGWTRPVDVWIQAASGGEARLALTLLAAWPEPPAHGELRVLVATWTKQGRELLDKGLAGLCRERPWLHAVARYAPLDDPAVARRAVAQAAPRALALLETELWPGLLGACTEAGVPVCLINARMTRASQEGYRILRSTLRRVAPRRILAVSRRDAERFADIFGADPRCASPDGREPAVVETMPNMKFDSALAALADPPRRDLAPVFCRTGPVFLLASTRKEEEKLVGPHLARLWQDDPTAALVVAPRHMARVDAWMELLADLSLKPLRASRLGEHQSLEPGGVLVWDRFGDLPQLYAVADAAFVGGSLKLGGQNFLEALSAGLTPCVGPSLDNFRWALGEDTPPSLEESGLLDVCPHFGAAADVLARRAREPKDRERTRAAFLDWIRPRAGGSALAARLLADTIASR